MEFSQMRDKLAKHFKEMTKDSDYLFEAALDKDALWNTYMDSYPPGTNEIYRTCRVHECSCCRHFIKSIGNAVAIRGNKITTIWDFHTGDSTFQPVLDAMSDFVKKHAVTDVFVSRFPTIGEAKNFQELEDGAVKKWDHFFLELPEQLVIDVRESKGKVQGQLRDTRNVFERSLEEITEESLQVVLELITSNSLYRGEEWKGVLKDFLKYKQEYQTLTDEEEKNNFVWEKSVKAGTATGRIRNHSMGTLLLNISEGMEVDLAVKKYEQIVAPSNYKRPKPIFTKKMLENAKKTITELGYLDALERRYATLDDITVNNILFSNKDAAKRIAGVEDIFGEMEREAVVSPKKFSKVEEIPADKFISEILPTAKEVEVYLEYRHFANFVSLTAPQHRDSKNMFQWNNQFGWAYSGNMTDSMKERVRAAGGKVDGDLRFSIEWNDDDYNPNDFDAHCMEPDNYEIYYPNKCRYSPSKGMLDVDIINPRPNIPAVENIIYENRHQMKEGTYQFFVHCYSNRGGRGGFKAELEFDGQIYAFDYNHPLKQDERVQVAEITYHKQTFSIKERLPSTTSQRTVWNLQTNQFVPVSVIMYSPNYWDEQQGVGNRHYFFMLKNCINPENPNGFYNEFLKNELAEHKRVFEALGSKMKVNDDENQLSGLGFCATKREELVVKVKGSTERIMKVRF